jgi:hypothetical protein
MQKNHLALSGAERANALGLVRILEDMLKNSPGRMRMHAHAIIRALQANIKQSDRDNIADLVEMGRLLFETRTRMRHGEWLPRLMAEFRWNERTARRYIQVFKLSQCHDLSGLSISRTALYYAAGSLDGEGPLALSHNTHNKGAGAQARILEEARTSHVSAMRAREIVEETAKPHLDAESRKFYEHARQLAITNAPIRLEKRMRKLVEKEFMDDAVLQAFLNAMLALPSPRFLKLVEGLHEVCITRGATRFFKPDFEE